VIKLVYSNATEQLLAALAEAVAAERLAGNPLDPVRLVVPNANVETYVKLGLAERAGIAANLEITFLRRFLARIAERALPHARAVDADLIEGCLLALLHDADRLAGDQLAPVRDYLRAAGDDDDAIDRRRCQLASQLARLFDEYASSRAKMLADWRAHARIDDQSRFAATERWQRALWLGIFAPGGLLDERAARDGTTFLPLGELLVAAERRLDPAALGGTLHVFGVSYVADSYHRMLALLGRQIDVRIYTLNPCREFWEDLDTAGEAARRSKREARRLFPTRHEGRQPLLALGDDPFGLAGDAEMMALRLWGRPGRENVRLLNQLTDADFEGRFRLNRAAGPETTGRGAAPAVSLLHRLQDDILDRIARDRPDPTLSADGSIAVLPCPGLRRELEVVAAEIWRMVRADPSLRFNQIAVIVPESSKEAYLAQIGAVFAESHDLPWSGVDLPAGHGHGIGEVVERLIDLPLGTFSRREVLPVLTHPAILSPARFPGVGPGDWIRLCDELAIVHGVDHGDHADTYIKEDLFNWDQGVRRAALGAVMTGPRSGDNAGVVFGDRTYLPAEPPAGEASGALSFGLLVRSLLEDARFAAGVTGPRTRPLGDWLEFIRGLIGAYLSPAGEADAAQITRVLHLLSDLEDVAESLGARVVSYRLAAELFRRRLRRIGGQRGQHLARGVAVASFVPMRAIPFRAIFLAGMGHGAFPSAAHRSELDLRGARRMPGDVSPREQDLYMFLETLLGARERLVLSYVARDELTGDPLEPSSVILELRDILRRGYLPAAQARALFDDARRIPLRRFDDTDRLQAHPPAARESQARVLGRSLAAALPDGAAAPDLSALGDLLPKDLYRRVTTALGLHRPPATTGRGRALSAATTVVSLQTLLQFLEDPLQGAARFRLRMREVEGEEESVDREDEPFETARGDRTRLLRAAILGALADPARSAPDARGPAAAWNDVRGNYQRLARHAELLGQIPTGLFRMAERPTDERILATWWRQALEIGGGQPPAGRLVRFGGAAESPSRVAVGAMSTSAAASGAGSSGDLHDPIVVELPSAADGPPRRLEIRGRTELLVDPTAGDATSASLVFSQRRSYDDAPGDRDLLRAFLDHVALAAAGLSRGAHEAVLAVADITGDAPAELLDRRRLAPLDAARARTYLATLANQLLDGEPDPATGVPTGVHPYLLPCEAIFEARRGKKTLLEAIEDRRELYLERNRTFSSVYGPVPQAVERHEPPPAPIAEAMMEARFGLLFELLQDPERQP
jgi:exodeoxyribonuclease V gamma subunit